MIELLVGFAFLFTLWTLGRSLVLVSNAKGYDWLEMPIGLALAGLIGNLLYFGIGLAVHSIQLVFLCALFPCLAIIVRHGTRRGEWMQLLAVCGIFIVLAAPAYIGGEQYYVFRGNQWDHFNYIDQALTIRDNRYSIYKNVSAVEFLVNDIWVHGLQFINLRPAVGLMFSMIMPSNRGDIHLLAFVYVAVLWAVVFPAFLGGWKRILSAYKISARRPLFSIGPPIAYVVGFWGQYIFDINAWSQMASLSLQLAFFFVYFGLLQKMVDPAAHEDQTLRADYTVTGLLAAGAFLFYPENAVMQAALLLASTILWCAVNRKVPGIAAVASFAFVSIALLTIAVAPNWQATVGFVIKQIRFGSAPVPVNWAIYFDSYWQGLHGSTGYYSKIVNFILASVGMFFVTPDYSAPFWMRCGWILISTGVVALLIYSLVACLGFRFLKNSETMFLKGFVIFGVLVLFYLRINGAVWAMGKALSYLSPYIFLVICLGWVEANEGSKFRLPWNDILDRIAIKSLVGILVVSQIAFGVDRLRAAFDDDGIGYDNAFYPSIQDTSLKTGYLWNLGAGRYVGCKGVHLFRDPGPFYLEYVKQKLTYLGVQYFSSLPVVAHLSEDKELGRQQSIYADCDAVFTKALSGKWSVESNEHEIDGVVDFSSRSPWVGLKGFGDPETWGSWTNGGHVWIMLSQYLPDRFTLKLNVVAVYYPNVGKLFRVRVGGQERAIIVTAPGIYSMTFQNVRNASDVEIVVPCPTSPQSLGISSDSRALGLGLKRMEIDPTVPVG